MKNFGNFEFEGSPITGLEYKGKAAMVVSQMGPLLQYKDEKSLLRLISRLTERNDLRAGIEFDHLFGDEAQAVARVVNSATSNRVGQIKVIYEEGLIAIAMAAHTPVAQKLRHYLIDVVFPAFKAFQAGESNPLPLPPAAGGSLPYKESRELRLRRAQEAKGLLLLSRTCSEPLMAREYQRRAGLVLSGHADLVAVAAPQQALPLKSSGLVRAEEKAKRNAEGFYTAADCVYRAQREFHCTGGLNRQAWGRMGRKAGVKGVPGLCIRDVPAYGRIAEYHDGDGAAHKHWQWNEKGYQTIVRGLKKAGLIGDARALELIHGGVQ